MFLSSELNQANVVPDPTVYAQEALSMSSMDDQSLFDSYENQKVPTGRPHKFVGGDAWSKKRPVDADFDDFHAPPKRANLYDGVKCEVQECVDDKRVIVPADPMCWTNDHVHQWVNWAVKEFSLKDVNVEAFTMCGRDLCRFTREDFMRLAPAYNGDILLAHLCVLRKAPLPDLTTDDIDKALAPPLSHQTSSCAKSIGQPRVTESERHACSSSVGGHSRTVPVARADGSEYMTNCVFQPPSNSSSGSDYQSRDSVVPNKAFCEGSPAPSDFPNGSVGAKTPSSLHAPPSHGGSGQIQLWQFLLELLSDPGNSSCIAWEGSNGEFKLTDPDEVARRWGERKNKPNMNYDKLSRALRYYYDKNIMTKIHGKRYAYKFDFQGLAQLNQPITSDAQLHAAQAAAYRGEYPFYTSYGPASSPYPYPPSGGVGSGYPACYSSLSPQNQYSAPAPYSAWGRPSYVPSMYRQNSLPYY